MRTARVLNFEILELAQKMAAGPLRTRGASGGARMCHRGGDRRLVDWPKERQVVFLRAHRHQIPEREILDRRDSHLVLRRRAAVAAAL